MNETTRNNRSTPPRARFGRMGALLAVAVAVIVAPLAFSTTASAARPASHTAGAAAEWHWADQGGRNISNAISTLSYHGNPYVFVRGGAGHLRVNYWTGSQWRWANQGGDITNAISATSYQGNPYVFV